MKKQYRSFEDARKFVRSLKLKNTKEWHGYCKSGNKPDDIPSNPQRDYKKKWISWMDWLDTENISVIKMNWRKFDEARKFVRKLKFKGNKEWKEFRKSDNKPDDIPYKPDRAYKNHGWINWGDWFGTGLISTKDRKYGSFEDTQEFVQSLKIKSAKEWEEYCKSDNKPDYIPSVPRWYYKKEWTTWGNFLGTGNVAAQIISKNYIPFKEARESARKLSKELGIKTQKQWVAAKKKGLIPNNLPSNPWSVYTKKRKRNEKEV